MKGLDAILVKIQKYIRVQYEFLKIGIDIILVTIGNIWDGIFVIVI